MPCRLKKRAKCAGHWKVAEIKTAECLRQLVSRLRSKDKAPSEGPPDARGGVFGPDERSRVLIPVCGVSLNMHD